MLLFTPQDPSCSVPRADLEQPGRVLFGGRVSGLIVGAPPTTCHPHRGLCQWLSLVLCRVQPVPHLPAWLGMETYNNIHICGLKGDFGGPCLGSVINLLYDIGWEN